MGQNSMQKWVKLRCKSTVSEDKAKCILDGILFEIFFNSNGEIRSDYKISRFNLVFSLKAYVEFSASFEFISETMIRYQSKFYVIPGKDYKVSIDILSEENSDNEYSVKEIHFQGFNILKKDDENGMYGWGAYPIKLSNLRKRLSEEMIIPENQLTLISFLKESDKILFPYGMSVAK